jgi:hypothetical protein
MAWDAAKTTEVLKDNPKKRGAYPVSFMFHYQFFVAGRAASLELDCRK